MLRINYTVRTIKINDCLLRILEPTTQESEHFVQANPDAILQYCDEVYYRAEETGGVINDIIGTAGGVRAQQGDEIPEVNLKKIDDGWYLRMGSVV